MGAEDLLRREPVRLDQAAISARLRDKTVLVTGAGGSIGSEVACELSSFKPKRPICKVMVIKLSGAVPCRFRRQPKATRSTMCERGLR